MTRNQTVRSLRSRIRGCFSACRSANQIRCGKHAFLRLVATLLVSLVGPFGGGREALGVASIPDGVRQQMHRDGRSRVIVQLNVPEARRAVVRPHDPREDQERRRAIKAKTEDLVSMLTPTSSAVTHEYETVPFVAVDVDEAGLAVLQQSGQVIGVSEDLLMEPTLSQSAPLVEANQASAMGYDGTSWAVAVLDTGVDKNHPFLAGSVVNEACFSANGNCPNGSSVQYGSGAGGSCTYSGGCAHGTHVAGIVAGSNASFSGVARSADIIAVQVFSRFGPNECGGAPACPRSYTSDQVKALEWVYSLRNTRAIAAVNMSLGGDGYTGFCDGLLPATKAAIDNLRAAGIATVIASGNNGYTNALSAPACISSAVSVGCTSKTDSVCYFSNSASFLALLAPGLYINSSVPGTGYSISSGTSMAAPHVAGAWAVLKDANPNSSVANVLSALQSNGAAVVDTRNALTHRRIRVLQSARLLTCGNGSIDPGETCDDHNAVNGDGCDTNCTVTACGNGIVTVGEECDDANQDEGDTCKNDCTDNICGDGLLRRGVEECDDGNSLDGDGCDSTCVPSGCALFTASDVPKSISGGAPNTITSTVQVPLAGQIKEVRVRLRGTHTYVSDLQFQLTSPSATTVNVMNEVCGSRDNFNLDLADSSTSPIPCPPTDGILHKPSAPLSAFNGSSAGGIWTLTVNDLYAGDGGSLDAWAVRLCTTIPCGNSVIDPGEQCDDGPLNGQSGQLCDSACRLASLPAGFSARVVKRGAPLSHLQGLTMRGNSDLFVSDIAGDCGGGVSCGYLYRLDLSADPAPLTQLTGITPALRSPARMLIGDGRTPVGTDLVLADYNAAPGGVGGGTVYRINDSSCLAAGGACPGGAVSILSSGHSYQTNPWGVALGPGGAFGSALYVSDEENVTATSPLVFRVFSDLSASIWYQNASLWTINRLPEHIEFGTGGSYGTDLYVVDHATTDGSPKIWRIDSSATATAFIGSGLSDPRSVRFAPSGAFGSSMFVLDDATGTIYTASAAGTLTPFASGLRPINTGGPLVGAPDMVFSPDAQHLYVGIDDAIIDIFPSTLPGNGVLDFDEECDDGNFEDGDCCNSSGLFEAQGSPCGSDGNVCTDDMCDATGACLHVENSAVCDDELFCNGADYCNAGTCSTHSGDPCAEGAACKNTCNEASSSCLSALGSTCDTDADICTLEECNGAGSCLPGVGPAPDGDADGQCDGADACTNSLGTLITSPSIKLKKLGTPSGDEVITLKGAVTLPVPISPPLNPTANGVRLRIEDSLGARVFDALIPGGTYDGINRFGWKSSPSGTKWIYKNGYGVQGITAVKLENKGSGDTPGLVRFSAKGKNGSYPLNVGQMPLRLTIAFSETEGQCGDTSLLAQSCTVSTDTSKVSCKE